MNWEGNYNYAIANGGRLLTLNEGQALIKANGAELPSPGWVAIGDKINKDWM